MRYPLNWHRIDPWIPELGYILHEDAARQSILEQDLSIHAVCSEVIPEVPSAIRRKKVLCFLGFKKGQISHVARSEIRYKARSGNDRLDIRKLEPLPKAISTRRLASAIKGPRSAVAKATVRSGGHLSPKAFELTLAALKSLDEDAFAVADGLYERTLPVSPALNEEGRTNWVLQRDAVVTALDLAKIPREQLAVTPQAGLNIQPGVVSIFDNIGEVRGLEDILVVHDLNGAAGWEPIRTHKFPAKTFRDGDNVLTVILANKLPLEQQLGVDLIYVNETLHSVVFVQYKVMKGRDGADGYRPDKQLDEEIARMDEAARILAALPPDVTCESYRIGEEAFFLKFCKDTLEHDDQGLVPGYYVPLAYWKRLAGDPRILGPRGGKKVTPTNISRYLTASNFKDLVSRAWIGTSAIEARTIVPLIIELQKTGRTVALAIKSEKPEGVPAVDDVDDDDLYDLS